MSGVANVGETSLARHTVSVRCCDISVGQRLRRNNEANIMHECFSSRGIVDLDLSVYLTCWILTIIGRYSLNRASRVALRRIQMHGG